MLRVSEIANCPACSDVLTNQNLLPKLTDASSPVAVVVANRDLQILDASQNTLLPSRENGQIWCTLRVESLQDFLVIHVLDRPGNLSNPHLLCWVNFPTWSIIGLDYSPRPTRSKKFLFPPLRTARYRSSAGRTLGSHPRLWHWQGSPPSLAQTPPTKGASRTIKKYQKPSICSFLFATVHSSGRERYLANLGNIGIYWQCISRLW